MVRKILLYSSVILLSLALQAPAAQSWTPNLFADHMVLQRDMPVPVWGWAEPGEKTIVRFKAQEKTARAGDDGKWSVTLDAMNADPTPHDMELISASGNKTIRDVLVGEVWLCSGQSNMEMTVSSCRNAPEEMATAHYPQIRHFRVYNTPDADKPLPNVSGTWQVCSPETVGGFSGAGFFFARELHNALNLPVGLIHASRGGTPAESWTSMACLQSEPDFKPILDRYQADLMVYPEKRKAYEQTLKPWLELEQAKGESADFVDTSALGETNGWADPDFDDTDWTTAPPGLLKAWKGPAVLWFRYHLSVPADWEAKDVLVDGLFVTPKVLGAHTLYFNGVSIDTSTATDWQEIRCTIPGNLLKPGPAVLALRVSTNKSSARLNAIFKVAPKGMATIVLRPPCRGCYKTAASKDNEPVEVIEYPGRSPRGPGDPNSPASLYNTYIHPLAPYSIRGALWYQGESNVGRAHQYRKLLPAMIQDWRAAWGQGDFPFLIVQLPNYSASRPDPEDSAWTELREAQAMTASTVPNTGLAVAIDIGDAVDMHPQDKQTLGQRLSLAARGIACGEDVVYSGPVCAAMKVEDEKIRLAFKSTGSGLAAKSGVPLKGFAVAGKDRKFVWAHAEIDGDTVLVSSDHVRDPVAVRYAWANNPEGCNLSNKEGLPAGPFRTDDWPGLTTNEK